MAHTWKMAHGRSLTLDAPRLLGIVNVTPDSFSDGGLHATAERAIARALQCLDEGADIVDIGGESTRPGAARVSEATQMARILPVVSGVLERRPEALISVDTTRAPVAQAAIKAGAHVINDVSAATEDSQMLPLAAATGAGIILMHRLRPPDQDSYSHQYDQSPPQYDNVVQDVLRYLIDRADAARSVGIDSEAIVLDPGLGFGKDVEQNFALIRATARFVAAGYPVLGAASRKSFIGTVSGVSQPARRLSGTLAVAVFQYLSGVRIFRVHDVQQHRQALGVAQRMLC